MKNRRSIQVYKPTFTLNQWRSLKQGTSDEILNQGNEVVSQKLMQQTRNNIKIESLDTLGPSEGSYSQKCQIQLEEQHKIQSDLDLEIKLQQELLYSDLSLDDNDIDILTNDLDDNSIELPKYPKYCQIQKGIEVLKSHFPLTFNETLINDLYELVFMKYAEVHERERRFYKEISEKQSIIDIESSSEETDNLIKQQTQKSIQNQSILNDNPEKEKTSNDLKNYQNKRKEPKYAAQDELTYQLKRITANTFCYKQVNYDFFKQELSKSGYVVTVPKQQYLSLLESVIRESYSTLQKKIRYEVKMKINPLTKQEVSMVAELYFKCTITLSKQICEIIYKLLKYQFKISNVTLTEEDCRKLYRATSRSVKDTEACLKLSNNYDSLALHSNKAGIKKPLDLRTKKAKLYKEDYLVDPRKKRIVHELDKKWNMQIENQLISLYKMKYQFSYIRDYFKSKYPEDRDMFEVVPVRSKLFKIVRKAVRRLHYFIANFGDNHPELVNLDDQRMKNILYTQTALDVRIILLDIHTRKDYDQKLVHQTIQKINKYFQVYEDYGQIRPGQGYWQTFSDVRVQFTPRKVRPKEFYRTKAQKSGKIKIK